MPGVTAFWGITAVSQHGQRGVKTVSMNCSRTVTVVKDGLNRSVSEQRQGCADRVTYSTVTRVLIQ